MTGSATEPASTLDRFNSVARWAFVRLGITILRQRQQKRWPDLE